MSNFETLSTYLNFVESTQLMAQMKAYVPNLIYNRVIVPQNPPGDNENKKIDWAGKNSPSQVLLGLSKAELVI